MVSVRNLRLLQLVFVSSFFILSSSAYATKSVLGTSDATTKTASISPEVKELVAEMVNSLSVNQAMNILELKAYVAEQIKQAKLRNRQKTTLADFGIACITPAVFLTLTGMGYHFVKDLGFIDNIKWALRLNAMFGRK